MCIRDRFIMVKKITNVTHVERHFLIQVTWKITLILFIMVKKITDVTIVESHFLKHRTWRNTLTKFIKVKKDVKKSDSCGKHTISIVCTYFTIMKNHQKLVKYEKKTFVFARKLSVASQNPIKYPNTWLVSSFTKIKEWKVFLKKIPQSLPFHP